MPARLPQFLKAARVDGAVVVTTPQEVSIIDVRKEINFCKKVWQAGRQAGRQASTARCRREAHRRRGYAGARCPWPPAAPCPGPQTGIPVLGVVENMSGLRQPLSAFKFYSPTGDDITAAVLASASAAAGGSSSSGDAGGGVGS